MGVNLTQSPKKTAVEPSQGKHFQLLAPPPEELPPAEEPPAEEPAADDPAAEDAGAEELPAAEDAPAEELTPPLLDEPPGAHNARRTS